MEPSFTKQILSASPSTRPSLLHGLKRILGYTNYSLGVVYHTIDGPFRLGHPFETEQDRLPVLTLLGGERAVGRHAKAQRHRKGSSFFPGDLFVQSGLTQEPFCGEDLVPTNVALGPDGLHSPVIASYLIYIDILADRESHRALHSLGSAEFHRVSGWLSESIFESGPSPGCCSSKGLKRYVCMEAFGYKSNMNEIRSVLQEFQEGTLAHGTGYANCKIRVYQLFGSVGKGI
ncbi:hypothetical protein PRZ48_002400 [Zasmidium cellare]|uniref:Uncharacterized protein n=1 Tax=Zasmidium cellare TaxID=395010 RepID=A0ABR0F5Z0_ZASCE|nr:hypothetical protein PRZ48_002400 [Zasmidium cellare]